MFFGNTFVLDARAVVAEFLYKIGGTVCHQIPERTILVGEKLLPVCARCTGIYTGMLLSFFSLLIWGRGKGNQPPPVKTSIFLVLCFLPLMIDAGGGILGLWHTGAMGRMVTGVFAGFPIPVFVILITQFQPKGENNIPVLTGTKEAVKLWFLGFYTACLIYFGELGYWISSFFLCLGILLLYSFLFMLVFSLLFPKQSRKQLACISFFCGSIAVFLIAFLLRR